MNPNLPDCYRCHAQPCKCADGITIYNADCRDVLPLLDSVELVLTDPPYGINQDGYRASLPTTRGRTNIMPIAGDDSEVLAAWLLRYIEAISAQAVVFGANNWPHLLPHKGRWWCWDKRCDARADKMLGSAFELAWDNRHSGFDRMIRVQHGGVVNADHKRMGRSHPTQKPVGVWLPLLEYHNDSADVVDPFAGSGTVGVACKDLGRKCIQIEIEEKYCEIAANRLEQGVLFT